MIDERERGRSELETIIHEAMHAQDWDKDGTIVRRDAHELAVLLWRLGYRKVEIS